MKPKNFLHRTEKRKKEAEERNKEWTSLTPQKQLKELDKRLGKNIGAKKQRTKIIFKIKETSKSKNSKT
jgi:hypothetical protein